MEARGWEPTLGWNGESRHMERADLWDMALQHGKDNQKQIQEGQKEAPWEGRKNSTWMLSFKFEPSVTRGIPKPILVSFIPSNPLWIFFLLLSPLELKLPTPQTSSWDDFWEERPLSLCFGSAASSGRLLSHAPDPHFSLLGICPSFSLTSWGHSPALLCLLCHP